MAVKSYQRKVLGTQAGFSCFKGIASSQGDTEFLIFMAGSNELMRMSINARGHANQHWLHVLRFGCHEIEELEFVGRVDHHVANLGINAGL